MQFTKEIKGSRGKENMFILIWTECIFGKGGAQLSLDVRLREF